MIKKKNKIEEGFKLKALEWASSFEHFVFLNFNDSEFPSGSFPCVLAVDASEKVTASSSQSGFDTLKDFYKKNRSWLFGYFGYDLKNQLENLSSNNLDQLGLPDLYFFKPKHIFYFSNDEVEIHSGESEEELIKQITAYTKEQSSEKNSSITIKQRVSKDEYLTIIEEIKKHLVEGDIYELNYCMEFYAEHSTLDPLKTFLALNTLSPMPFSAFMRIEKDYLICASPERFLKKEKNKLLSQPIKGTSRRGANKAEDDLLKNSLQNSEKERSENMMIVDLVRNDLARSSKTGSVKVEELFGIYSFRQVHQMISTVSSELKDDIHFLDAIKNAFPMGSMTGAPKIKAMELIEKFEYTKRGLFSGAAGFITSEGDFDLNVVIRSIIYSEEKKYISFQVGSAITYDSDPEKEYQECLVKAEAMRKTLENFEF